MRRFRLLLMIAVFTVFALPLFAGAAPNTPSAPGSPFVLFADMKLHKIVRLSHFNVKGEESFSMEVRHFTGKNGVMTEHWFKGEIVLTTLGPSDGVDEVVYMRDPKSKEDYIAAGIERFQMVPIMEDDVVVGYVYSVKQARDGTAIQASRYLRR